MPDREVLGGGVANAGAVVREGAHVLRPANAHTHVVHDLLRWVRAAGFEGVSEPVGVGPDGRERLVCIPGDVPVPRGPVDPGRRLRVLADGYGLPPGREKLVDVIEQRMSSGNDFVRRRVERGEEAFAEMWGRMGGGARYERRVAWFRAKRDRLVDALG